MLLDYKITSAKISILRRRAATFKAPKGGGDVTILSVDFSTALVRNLLFLVFFL